MADNVAITPGSGATAAADDIGGVLYQRVKITTGTDGVADGDVSSANPMPVKIPGVTSDAPLPVRLDQGPEAILSNNGSLQVDATQSNEMSAESLNAPNAALVGDEPVQMVGLHPSFPLPIDTATPMPAAGRTSTGAFVPIRVADDGSVQPQDSKEFRFWLGSSPLAPTRPDVSPTIDLNGFSTIMVQINSGLGGNSNVFFDLSNDGATWVATSCLNFNGTSWIPRGSPIGQTIPVPALFMIYAAGRYFRMRTVNAGTDQVNIIVVLRNNVPAILPNYNMDLRLINGAAISTAAAQLAVNSFNTIGPAAPGAAHGASNPLQMSGSDGTNVRRILTDTSGNTRVVGPLAAGTSLIPPTNAAFAPALMGIADLEGRVQRATGDVRGRVAATLPDATAPAEDGIIDALNNVVRELKLLNAKITDLPYWLGINSVMPDDGQTFRDDPTLFNQ